MAFFAWRIIARKVVRNHADIVPIAQGAGNMGNSGTSGESDRLILLNQFAGSDTDPALLSSTMLLPVLKDRIVAEGLIQEWLD